MHTSRLTKYKNEFYELMDNNTWRVLNIRPSFEKPPVITEINEPGFNRLRRVLTFSNSKNVFDYNERCIRPLSPKDYISDLGTLELIDDINTVREYKSKFMSYLMTQYSENAAAFFMQLIGTIIDDSSSYNILLFDDKNKALIQIVSRIFSDHYIKLSYEEKNIPKHRLVIKNALRFPLCIIAEVYSEEQFVEYCKYAETKRMPIFIYRFCVISDEICNKIGASVTYINKNMNQIEAPLVPYRNMFFNMLLLLERGSHK